MTFNKTKKKILATIMLVAILSCSFLVYTNAATDDFQETLDLFPESYHSYLIELHEQYPLWEFEPMYTGLDWDEAVAAQEADNKALVTSTSGYSDIFKSTDSDDYNSSTDAYIEHDSGFVAANEIAVSYYLDPRNFLTVEYIFQFEDLSFNDSFTITDVELVLTGSFMSYTTVTYYNSSGKLITTTDTYAELIYEAGQTYDINPCYLASKILNEVGSSGSSSVSGTYSGYEGYYNFYNIGAYDGTDAIANGLSWASSGTTYGRPWTSPEASIFGGAEYIAENYIAKGQYTGYLQRFNVNPDSYYTTHTHQYMTNISGAVSQGYTNYLSYLASGSLDEKYVFSIPVYENMSAETSGEGDITLYDSVSQYATINVSSSNVRTGPSTAYSTLGFTLSNGTQVEIIDQVSTDTTYYLNVLKYPYWAQIQFTVDSTTYTGYVPMDFLDVTSYSCVDYGTRELSYFTSSADVNVSFYSSDTSIAKVNDDNTITFLSAGTVTITAFDSLQKYSSYSYKVTSVASTREISGLKAYVSGSNLVVSYTLNSNIGTYEIYVLNKYGEEIFSTTTTSSSAKFTFADIADASVVLVRGYKTLSSDVYSYGEFASYSLSTINPVAVGKASIKASWDSYDSIILYWNALDEADGYNIYQLIGSEYVLIDTVKGGTASSYKVEGLSADTQYSFKIRAYAVDSEGVYTWGSESSVYSTKTIDTQTQITSVIPSNDEVILTWSEISVADGYRVYFVVDGKTEKIVTLYGSSTTSYTVTGLEYETDYSFTVRAFIRDSSGTAIFQASSDTVTTTTASTTTQIISAKASCDQVALTWSEIAVADGYRVYFVEDGKTEKIVTLYGSSATSYTVTGLEYETDYSFTVRAFVRDNSGTAIFQEFSDTVNTTTLSTTVEISSAQSSYDQVSLTWSKVSVADGYRVYFVVDGQTEKIATLYGSSETSYTVTGLEYATDYTFTVRAFIRDSSGTAVFQDFSDTVSVSTNSTTVQINSTQASCDQVSLTWSELSVADGYRVYFVADGKTEKIVTLYGSSATSYTVTDLDYNKTYSFAVRAFIRDSSGTAVFQDFSDTVSASTNSTTVQINSTKTTSTTASLTWSELPVADGYRVYYVANGKVEKIVTVYGSSSTSYTVTGLSKNSEYSFCVSAFIRDSSGTAIFQTFSDTVTVIAS